MKGCWKGITEALAVAALKRRTAGASKNGHYGKNSHIVEVQLIHAGELPWNVEDLERRLLADAARLEYNRVGGARGEGNWNALRKIAALLAKIDKLKLEQAARGARLVTEAEAREAEARTRKAQKKAA